MKRLTVLILTIVAFASACRADDSIAELVKMFKDPRQSAEVLAGLRATDDKDLAPFFIALSAGGDKDLRLFATSALVDLAGKQAAIAPLAQRLAKDDSMPVRVEALLALSASQNVDRQQLQDAMSTADQSLQIIAARTAIQLKIPELALPTLQKLTAAKDTATAGMARMSLLGQGDSSMLPPLRELFRDAATPPDVLTILLDQIVEEKIAAACDLAQVIAQSDQPWQLRLRAYRAMAAVSPQGAKVLYDAILANAAGGTPFQVHLLRELARRNDSAAYVEKLRAGQGPLALMARFELARPAGGADAASALAEAMQTGHPVLADYILSRAENDFSAADKGDSTHWCDFYVPTLLAIIEAVKDDPQEIKPQHVRATKAAMLLADYGSPAAMAGLGNTLSGNYRPAMRMAAAGLLKSKNIAAADLLRPHLQSPYEEMSTNAALVLGRQGHTQAVPRLKDITDHSDKHAKLLVVLAHWYQLKIQGKGAQAAAALTKEVN